MQNTRDITIIINVDVDNYNCDMVNTFLTFFIVTAKRELFIWKKNQEVVLLKLETHLVILYADCADRQ